MKNLAVYNIEDFDTEATTGIDFTSRMFVPCGTYETSRVGFVPTVFGSLVEVLPDATVLTVCTQKKSPKKAHVEAIVADKKEDMFEAEGRYPSKTELETIKDEATSSVLGMTFPNKAEKTNVIFHNNGKVYLDTTYRKAEDILSFLRDVIGSLPTYRLSTKGFGPKLNTYVLDEPVEPFSLGNKAKIVDNEGKKASITSGFINPEAEKLVNMGGNVEELGLDFDGTVEALVVKESLEITGIKFEKSFTGGCDGDEAGSFMMQYRELVRMFDVLLSQVESDEE